MRFITRFFPIRAKSIGAFIDLVKLEGCTTVQILPVERGIGMPGAVGCSLFIFSSTGVERVGTERYLQYSARTPQGRVIKHCGNRTVRYDAPDVFGKISHESESLILFFEEERQARNLRSALRGVVVEELDFLGIPITQATRKHIHHTAAEYGVMPPEGNVS